MPTPPSPRSRIWPWPICAGCRPGTLPPVVLKFDASSLPVCLITLKGEGLNETQLRDLGQYDGAQPDRQRARRLRAAALRRTLPPDHGLRRSAQAGGPPTERHGRGAHGERLQPDSARRRREDRPFDYNLYTNSQLDARSTTSIDCRSRRWAMPRCWWPISARPKDAAQIQTNIVRVDGQRSVYLPVLKQGGDTNTIAVVDGIKDGVAAPARYPKATHRQGGVRSVGLRARRPSRTCSTKAPSAWC